MAVSQKVIGQYNVLGTLGSGNSAKVKLGENRITHEKVAIKILKKANLQSRPMLYAKLQREIALMSLFEHPHILRLYEVFESERHLHIVMEYAENRELFDLLVQCHRLQEEEGLDLFRQIIYALEYLHSLGICHRDLKPENILLDANNNIKIADFGFARWMKSDVASTSCGSPHYAAPEVIRAQPYSGRQADIWSAGVILYAMLSVCIFIYLFIQFFFRQILSLFSTTHFYGILLSSVQFIDVCFKI
ncbi:CAMK family protein kinase [Tritrichomonas foetus]|uniref:CAMK family protein kinase n=1 Tax=Tritrichomonas foetus TaxID=1144522 RepID=A0A1J4KBB1_9EUKA|nr:CAMK family protein kinase [Tritrichomonas foetus]|eukprot:OHT08703.1 CAMK family protein kinase [Tritrichomonas foetus]